jgi:hypothetical protein
MGGFLIVRRSSLQAHNSWWNIIGHAMVAAGIYAALFLIAMDRDERDWYFNKLKEIFKRGSVVSAKTDLSTLS